MTNLKDYLASLVIGVNEARMLADLESARIAQLYANHDILQNYAVPHFRLPDVELNIPVAIEQLDKKPVKDYQPIDNKKFNAFVYQNLKDYYMVKSFSSSVSKRIRTIIATSSNDLEKNLKKDNDKTRHLKMFSNNVVSSVASLDIKHHPRFKPSKDLENNLKKRLVQNLEPMIIPKHHDQDIEDSKVIVEANKLKEVNPNTIITIKMKLTEEGMEWHKIDKEDGQTNMKLIPE